MPKLGTYTGPSEHSCLCIGSSTAKRKKNKNWKMNLLKCCQHKMFKAARSSAEMACGKNTSNLIQLPLTVVLSLFCPCFLKIGLRGGIQGRAACVYCRWYRRSGSNFTSLYPITYSRLRWICSLCPLNWFLHLAQLRFVPDPKAKEHFLQGFS